MAQAEPSKSRAEGRAVLVTGCSSGIGRAAAVALARQGFATFATVRKPADADALRALGDPNLIPVCPLDLTHPEHIEPLRVFVARELEQRGLDGLYGLVNNAGAGGIAPVELMDVAAFRAELEARLVGPVALLQALLPLIRRAQGRVVWIVTPALIPIKYVGSIHIADFAVNCLARTLNLELKPWGIPNILIRCGGIRTAAPARSDRELEDALKAWPPERLNLYRESLRAEQQELAQFDEKRTEPEAVARLVCRALSARRPRSRYRIGYMAGLAGLLELMPQAAADKIMQLRG